jgi:hypothetical protein
MANIPSQRRGFSGPTTYYPNYKNQLHTSSKSSFPNDNRSLCYLNLKVLSSDGEILAQKKIPSWQPFSTLGSQISMIGPFTSCGGSQTRLDIVKPIIQKVLVKVPIELLKEIKKVDISLEPIEPKLVLQPARR